MSVNDPGMQLDLERREQEAQREHEHREYQRRLRLCPPSLAVDDRHLLTKLSGGLASNRERLLARTMMARGLVRSGVDKAAVARAFGWTPADLEDELERTIYWTPTPEELAGEPAPAPASAAPSVPTRLA